MDNALQIFENPEFGKVRGVEINGVPYLVGKDVATVLGYSNTRDALNKHVDEEDKNTVAIHDGIPGNPNQVVINESGVYSLIFGSKLPAAKRFKRWVTSEVLPAIQKHGMYMTDSVVKTMLQDPRAFRDMIDAYISEHEKRLELEKANAVQAQQIEELQPKATYYDLVLSCQDAVPISVLAKDYGWTGRQMNSFLHDKGVQYKVDGTWLLYKKHADKGYTKTYTYTTWNKITTINTNWTQKGRLFIYELMKEAGHLPVIEQEGNDAA